MPNDPTQAQNTEEPIAFFATVARPVYFNAHGRPYAERTKDFSWVLPLQIYDEQGRVFDYYPPKWGYIPVKEVLKDPRAIKLLGEYVIPVEMAVRIIYEEMWFFQSKIVKDWLTWLKEKLWGIVKSFGWTIASVAASVAVGNPIGGVAVRFYEIYLAVYEDNDLNQMFVDATDMMVERMLGNSLTHRFIDVEERLLYPENDFKMPRRP